MLSACFSKKLYPLHFYQPFYLRPIVLASSSIIAYFTFCSGSTVHFTFLAFFFLTSNLLRVSEFARDE